MQGKRVERVAALVKQELASSISRDLKDPRIGFITITDVYMSDDLKHARVFYSALGTDDKKEETQQALNQARGFLQKDIANNLNLIEHERRLYKEGELRFQVQREKSIRHIFVKRIIEIVVANKVCYLASKPIQVVVPRMNGRVITLGLCVTHPITNYAIPK